MADELYNSLREEILRVKDHSFQRSGTKIMFTTLLMGLGSIKPQLTSIDSIAIGTKVVSNFSFHVEPLLYLAPLVAIFYDALLFGDKISIRRIGTFIRRHYPDSFGKWEEFVNARRFEWHKDDLGELGFQLLLSCIAQLSRYTGLMRYLEKRVNLYFQMHLSTISSVLFTDGGFYYCLGYGCD